MGWRVWDRPPRPRGPRRPTSEPEGELRVRAHLVPPKRVQVDDARRRRPPLSASHREMRAKSGSAPEAGVVEQRHGDGVYRVRARGGGRGGPVDDGVAALGEMAIGLLGEVGTCRRSHRADRSCCDNSHEDDASHAGLLSSVSAAGVSHAPRAAQTDATGSRVQAAAGPSRPFRAAYARTESTILADAHKAQAAQVTTDPVIAELLRLKAETVVIEGSKLTRQELLELQELPATSTETSSSTPTGTDTQAVQKLIAEAEASMTADLRALTDTLQAINQTLQSNIWSS